MRPTLSTLTSGSAALRWQLRLKVILAQGSTRPHAAWSRARLTRAALGNRSALASAGVIAIVAALLAATASASADAPAADCQPFLDDRPCLQPFPSNLYTKKADTPTGRRVRLPADAMPVNTEGVAINAAEWNRNDGFSPGSMITVHVPGLATPQALRNTDA